MSWLDVPKRTIDALQNTVKNTYIDSIKAGLSHEDVVCAIYSAVYTGIFYGQVDMEMKM